MTENNVTYQLALTLIPLIGDVLAKTLLSYCGGPEDVFKARKKDLIKVPGIDEARATSILAFDQWNLVEKEVAFIEKNKIATHFYLDENYPSRLKGLTDAPIMLYSKGRLAMNVSKIISVVGTRHATEYGKQLTESLIEGLKAYQATIVSGMAYGIDIVAHRAALKVDLPTIAVMGHGLNRFYPWQHRATAVKMLDDGGLLTEFKSIDAFEPQNFPKRNRIVAGMADATLVVESAVNGGALITAEIASSYNRDVFAVPGRVGEKFSEGCNYFIKTNKANLIESAEDIALILGWVDQKNRPAKQKQLFIELSTTEQQVVDALQELSELQIDSISSKTNLYGSALAAALLNLEFKSVVISLPGKVYRLA